MKKLEKHGVQKSKITSITGHRSTKGLDLYDEGEENQQKVLSNIVGGEITRSITPTSSSLPSISVSQLRLEYPTPYETVSNPTDPKYQFYYSICPSIKTSSRQQLAPAHIPECQNHQPVQRIFNISHW